MKRFWSITWLVLILTMLAAWPDGARAQGGYQVVTGKEFDSAMVKEFYLEGNAIPTQKRNAALVKTPQGARVLFALIDTTGYSSHIQQKYEGMIISEGGFKVCGQKLGVGSFGFGHTKPTATSNEDMKLHVYDQAGAKIAECSGKKDAALAQPKPLQVVKGEPTKLYLGRHAFDLE
jgi:hypothetical protein